MKRHAFQWCVALACCVVCVAQTGRADDLVIQSFDATGQMVFHAPAGGTDYNYRVEWAPSAGGPWSTFGGAGAFWLDTIQAAQGSSVTAAVPTCYRVVATSGEYLAVDLSGGPEAASYPVTYYRTLADVPGSPNTDTYKTDKLLMRLIPRGTFMMGSPVGELGRTIDETQHQVTLSRDFYIGVFEVTQKQWERVMGTWPSGFTNHTHRDTRPVERVNYNMIRGSTMGAGWPASGDVDADSFMGRLRTRTGRVFDLPTDSQREYAGRAGASTALNSGMNLTSTGSCPNVSTVGRYWYNGGSNYNYSGDASAGTAKVGSYLPNAWGLYDTHGNVWEWCLDWSGVYPGAVSDPEGPPSGSYRVLRGGGWYNGAYYCRTANRIWNTPDYTPYTFGFRVAVHLDK